MHSWNVVVTTFDHHYQEACHYLNNYGHVCESDYFNVVTLQVDDIDFFLQLIHQHSHENPNIGQAIARVAPVFRIFTFQSPSEFEEHAQAAITPWVDALAGSRFHVRMHRRGFKGRIHSQGEERFLDYFLLHCLSERGASATLDFDDPDFILALETVGQRGGVSFWSREARLRFPLLKLD